jgi:hypothetical protein
MTTDEERRHYDGQMGALHATVHGLTKAFEDFRGEQRAHNAGVIDRLDIKINGRLDSQGAMLGTHAVALATLESEVATLKASTPMHLPTPVPDTTSEVTDADTKPLTRRDLQVAVATAVAFGGLLGLLFKFWPVLQAAAGVP